MQRLSIRHRFPCSVDTFWEMFWDEEYEAMVSEAAAVERETLEDRMEGEVRVLVSRTTPDRELPVAVAKVIGANKLIYTQTTRFDRAASRLSWEVQPNVMADKVTAKGLFEVRPTDEGCERSVAGEIEVRVPLIGRRVEKAIVEDVSRNYDEAAKASLRWLAARRTS